MKIVFFGHQTNASGAEKTLYEFIFSLKQATNHDLLLVLPNKKGSMYDVYKQLAIKTQIVPYTWAVEPTEYKKTFAVNIINKINFFIKYLNYTTRIILLLKSERPDIVFTNTVAIPWAAFACRFLSIKHVWNVREDFREEGTVLSVYNKLYNKNSLFDLSSVVLMPSNDLVEKWRLSKSQQEKIKIIYSNPLPQIKIDFRDNKVPKTLRAIWVGTYNYNKDPLFALNEIKNNIDKLSNWKFSFFGNGPLYEILRRFVEDNSLHSQVDINSHHQNLEKFFLESHVALSTSKNEAFGRSLAEAAKFGNIPVYPCGTSWEERFTSELNSLCFDSNSGASLTLTLNRLEDERFYRLLRSNLYDTVRSNFGLELPEVTLAQVLKSI